MKMFVYTHRIDCDGLCSAAILKRYMDSKGIDGNIDFINYDPPEDLERIFRNISEMNGDSEVIIADFGYNDNLKDYADSCIKKFSSNGGKLAWLDHHKWDNTFLENLRKHADITLAKSDELCGAELVYNRYMKGDDVSEAIAKIGRDSDIDEWKTSPPKAKYSLTDPLGSLITYYNYLGTDNKTERRDLLMSIVDKLSTASLDDILSTDFDGPLFDGKLERDWNEYKHLSELKMKECIDNATEFSVGGDRYVVGFSDRILSSSYSGNGLIRQYNADVSIVFHNDGGMSFRRSSNNSAIKCDRLANLFEGGGHEYASGGRMHIRIKDDKDISEAKKLIERTIRNFYKEKG